MPQYQTWEEFSRAAEKLYLADPMKARVVLKYRHSDGSLCIKVTDDLVDLNKTQSLITLFKILEYNPKLLRTPGNGKISTVMGKDNRCQH
nr:signal recognition particle 9 kDa protein isoform X1 [Marmota flaviventris]